MNLAQTHLGLQSAPRSLNRLPGASHKPVFVRHHTTEPIFKSLNSIPLNSPYYYIIGLLMYKLSNGPIQKALNELYVKNNEIHHYPTRNSNKFHIKTSRGLLELVMVVIL